MTRKHGGGLAALAGPPDEHGAIALTLLDPVGDAFLDSEPNFMAQWTGARTLRIGHDDVQKLVPRQQKMSGRGDCSAREALENTKIYPKLFDTARPADHCPELLAELGELLTQPSNSLVDSTVPAAYTYFGQFIAHDITRMTAEPASDRSGDHNLRTPALDLDSLFGALDACEIEPEGYNHNLKLPGTDTLQLGPTTASGGKDYNDLPRAPSGEPQIADARNDQNLGVAQIQVLLTKFYRFVAQEVGPENAQRVFTDHVQWVVLDDYLRKLIDFENYNDVLVRGPRLLSVETRDLKRGFLIPLEFSLACFRVGHAMLRDRYQWTPANTAGVKTIIKRTHNGGDLKYVEGYHRQQATWRMHWKQFIDTGEPAYPSINQANSLGSPMSTETRTLPINLIDELETVSGPIKIRKNSEGTFNLVSQTLLRGNRYGLCSGQSLYDLVVSTVKLPPKLTAVEIANPYSDAISKAVYRMGFADDTPLWYYCLREAAVQGSGSRFGPLGGRIVLETVYAAIEADCEGILSPEKRETFRPEPRWSDPLGRFGLKQMIKCAQQAIQVR